MSALLTNPDKVIVGVLDRLSEKAAVIVTSDIGIKLSASAAVRVTVGGVISAEGSQIGLLATVKEELVAKF